MAEDKKSFILYSDLISTVGKLPDEIAGKLFKIILNYVNDKNPVVEDLLLQIAFEPVKLQLKRDLKKFEDKKEKWSDAGKKSAEKRSKNVEKNSTDSTDVKNVEPPSTDSTVTDNVTVNVNDNDIINNKNYLNKKFPSMPLASDLDAAPKTKIKSAIEMLKITNQVDVEEKEVITMWNIFKDQNLTGKRYYPDKDSVYSHFLNWIIKKDFKKQQNGISKAFTKPNNSKSAGAYEALGDLKSSLGI